MLSLPTIGLLPILLLIPHLRVCYGLNALTLIDLIPIPQESKVSFKA